MGFWGSIFQGYKAGKDGARSDWYYRNIENSPLLMPSEELKYMNGGATREQKASIYKHLIEHDVVDPQYGNYYDLANEIRSEFE